jgi:hypothetical protein
VECYRRDESVVPQQALALANSPLALSSAKAIAAKLTGSDAEFVVAAFETVLSRQPTADEQAACMAFLKTQEGRVRGSSDPRQRAREGLAHVLLNHNDFVTVR